MAACRPITALIRHPALKQTQTYQTYQIYHTDLTNLTVIRSTFIYIYIYIFFFSSTTKNFLTFRQPKESETRVKEEEEDAAAEGEDDRSRPDYSPDLSSACLSAALFDLRAHPGMHQSCPTASSRPSPGAYWYPTPPQSDNVHQDFLTRER